MFYPYSINKLCTGLESFWASWPCAQDPRWQTPWGPLVAAFWPSCRLSFFAAITLKLFVFAPSMLDSLFLNLTCVFFLLPSKRVIYLSNAVATLAFKFFCYPDFQVFGHPDFRVFGTTQTFKFFGKHLICEYFLLIHNIPKMVDI